MLLFDIIRDWFVMYIWGGCTISGDIYGCAFGTAYYLSGDTMQSDEPLAFINNILIKTSFYDFNTDKPGIYISLGDWLSTTSTIIVMVLLCIVFGLMVRWLFRLTSGLLQGKC